jgi:DNA-binding transcriptional regulator YiaG
MKPQAFSRPSEPMADATLHYTDCGLDYVFLQNGFEVETIDGEEYLSITDLDGLHRAIGMHIVMARKAPTGRELRFLRNELKMSQADLGRMIGVTYQSVARWEKGQTDVPGPAVFSVKLLYLLSLMPMDKRAELSKRFLVLASDVVQLDEVNDRAEFAFVKDRWDDIAA